MYRKQCVLALITLYARLGLAHTFSWDFVVSRNDRLEFYYEGTLTYSVSDFLINWLTYDPFQNRVLFSNSKSFPTNDGECIYAFDIATKKTELLINSNACQDMQPDTYVYDPATELLFGAIESLNPTVYSFLIKSGFIHEGDGDLVTNSIYNITDAQPFKFAVDSCGGYLYWTTKNKTNRIERARFNGSDREIIIEGGNIYRDALTIDSLTQQMYFCEYDYNYYSSVEFSLVSADLNGKNRKRFYEEIHNNPPHQLIVSKDFIYWTIDEMNIWQLPKNPNATNVKPKQFLIDTVPRSIHYIAANYKLEEQSHGIPLCKTLKSVLSIYPAIEDSPNVSTVDNNQFPANETKVSGESWVSEKCDVYQYYCFQGDCSTNTEGLPKCRCYTGYSGQRCEVNVCHAYCLNDGICFLNEKGQPACRCTQGYEGSRCEVSQPECFHDSVTKTTSILIEILNAVEKQEIVLKQNAAGGNNDATLRELGAHVAQLSVVTFSILGIFGLVAVYIIIIQLPTYLDPARNRKP